MSTLIRRLAEKCLDFFDVGDGHGTVFFRRWDLVKTRWGALYLHQFFRGDMDRCLHDHPWDFWTLILWGGYWEEMPDGVTYWRGPGSLLKRRAEVYHRVTLETGIYPGTRSAWPKPWSLVWVGAKRRAWGFHTPSGWVKWVKGVGNPICEDKP